MLLDQCLRSCKEVYNGDNFNLSFYFRKIPNKSIFINLQEIMMKLKLVIAQKSSMISWMTSLLNWVPNTDVKSELRLCIRIRAQTEHTSHLRNRLAEHLNGMWVGPKEILRKRANKSPLICSSRLTHAYDEHVMPAVNMTWKPQTQTSTSTSWLNTSLFLYIHVALSHTCPETPGSDGMCSYLQWVKEEARQLHALFFSALIIWKWNGILGCVWCLMD